MLNEMKNRLLNYIIVLVLISSQSVYQNCKCRSPCRLN